MPAAKTVSLRPRARRRRLVSRPSKRQCFGSGMATVGALHDDLLPNDSRVILLAALWARGQESSRA